MLLFPLSHKQYLRFVRHRAGRSGGLPTGHRHYQIWGKLRQTNLDLAQPLLASLYAPDQGRPARSPVCMLRSCLAMMACGETSFDEWVALMRDDPFHALISGFDPEDVPGVGTFYDFQNRLLQRTEQGRTTAQRPHYHRETQDKSSEQQDKNNLQPHQGIVKRLADRIGARREQPTPLAAVLDGFGDFSALPKWEQSLQAIFFACFVARSVELKLIDPHQLHVAGDGTKGAFVDGPMALDVAIDKESADTKGVKGEVPGDADGLVFPNIDAGNVFYKTNTKLCGCELAAMVVGATVPCVVSSRGDTAQTKLYSIALAALSAK